MEPLVQDQQDLRLIIEALSSFFLRYKRSTTVEELASYFLTLHPGLNKDQRDFYGIIFSNIDESSVSEEVIEELLQTFQKRQALVALAVSAYEASEGRKEVREVTNLAEQIGSTEQVLQSETTYVTDDLQELHTKTISAPGLRWRLKSLNTSIGSLRKGDFGFIFARPETGKTTFLASECSFMASQAASPVLWFNNEEQGEKVMLRCYQAALGATLEQLFSSISKATEQFKKYTNGNLRIVDRPTISKQEVESICQSVQPSLIVFDQIDKIGGFKADRDDLVLGAIYQWARELAKTYCPVMGICQADGTAEGVKWLTMSHVANAKTSKQAEADWILGIGRSNDAGYEAVRHFNISKNKLIGDKDSIPSRRHDKWDVLLEPEQARYRDIID